ncbi:MAG: UPF0280 family protein [Pseudomonadota bacterium]
MPAGGRDRLHLQHGPIDLLVDCHGPTRAVELAYARARARFSSVLPELVDELPTLRAATTAPCALQGAVARRMHAATLPHAAQGFITPMAAVAGAVADDMLSVVWDSGLQKATVNNGGDIALRLAPGARARVCVASLANTALAHLDIRNTDGVGGLATSGSGGRSLSLGVADTVTVLAGCAADADAAATVIANAVDLPGCPRITREPACALAPDSDLGDRPVVTQVGVLHTDEVGRALDSGARVAKSWVDGGHIVAAALFLRGEHRVVGRGIALQ